MNVFERFKIMNNEKNSIFDSMDLLYLKECMRCGGHQELMKRWQVDDIDYANPHSSENLFFTKAVPRRYKWSRLAEIEALLSEGYIRTALISALIVADICSSIGGVSSDRKLEEWIEESIRKYEVGCHGIDIHDKTLPQNKSDLWTGKLCVELRNNLVHGCTKDLNELVNSWRSKFKSKYCYHYIDTVFTDGCMNRSIEFNCIKDKSRVKVLVFELSIPLLIMKIVCAADVCYNENISGNEKYFSDGYNLSEPTCQDFELDAFFDKNDV